MKTSHFDATDLHPSLFFVTWILLWLKCEETDVHFWIQWYIAGFFHTAFALVLFPSAANESKQENENKHTHTQTNTNIYTPTQFLHPLIDFPFIVFSRLTSCFSLPPWTLYSTSQRLRLKWSFKAFLCQVFGKIENRSGGGGEGQVRRARKSGRWDGGKRSWTGNGDRWGRQVCYWPRYVTWWLFPLDDL